MRVSEIMTPVVQAIETAASLEQASEQMRDQDVGFLPVVDEAGLAGAVTDRDIVVRAIAAGKDAKATPVAEVMTLGLACCYEDEDSSAAAAVMEQEKVRRVFVLDRDGLVVGVVSLGDVSADDTRMTGEVLHNITEQGC